MRSQQERRHRRSIDKRRSDHHRKFERQRTYQLMRFFRSHPSCDLGHKGRIHQCKHRRLGGIGNSGNQLIDDQTVGEHAGQGGCRKDRENDIGRRHRKPHPEHKRRQRDQDQRDQQRALRPLGDHQGKGIGHTGCDDRVIDQADGHQQNRRHGRGLHAHKKRFADLLPRHLVGREPAGDDQRRDRKTGGITGGAAGDQHVGHHPQRQKEIERARVELSAVDDILLLDADIEFHRLYPDDEGDRHEIHNGGHHRIENDRAVIDPRIGHHHERTGAHDRRHDLPAGGRRRLHAGGKYRAEPVGFHQRNRDHAGRRGIGDGRAGNRAGQSGSEHGDEGRTAPETAGHDLREFDHEIRCARDDQEGAEDHEQRDIRRRDRRNDAEHALVVIHRAEENVAQRQARHAKRAGQNFSEKQDVGHRNDDQDRDDPAGQAPGQVDRRQDDDNTGGPVEKRKLPGLAGFRQGSRIHAVFGIGDPAGRGENEHAIEQI